MSACVKQVAAAWGTVEYSKAATSCPKQEEPEKEEDGVAGGGGSTFLSPAHVGHSDPRASQLRRLLHRLSSLEHSLRRTVLLARGHPLSMVHSRAACANLELLQARAYATAGEVTEHVFGGAVLMGGAGGPYPGAARPPVAGQPAFLSWAHERLLRQDAEGRAGREALRAQLALEPALPVDEHGERVRPAGPGRGALRRARSALRRAGRVEERRDSLDQELDGGWLIGPMAAPDDAVLEAAPPFSTWAGAFAWALGSLSELTVPGASSEARAADLLLYHVPRVCSVVTSCADGPRRAYNFTVVGPSSGDSLGWLECPFCPPERSAVLFAGERTAQDIPEDAATGRAGFKHPGMADVLEAIAGFCRKALPADAPLLAKHAEDLVRALEGAERAMHDETGAAAVVSAVTMAAQAAGALPQAPKKP